MSLTKLATALTVIFVISLVALIAQLLFVLWRNHVFRRQTLPTTTTHDGINHRNSDTTVSPAAAAVSSKEQLLFFLCLRTQPQIDFTGAPISDRNRSSSNDLMMNDVFKVLGGFQEPSRVLCTIKEEEREGVESDDSAKKAKGECLQACFEVTAGEAPAVVEEVAVTVEEEEVAVTVEEEEVAVTVEEEEGVETTPYSTPCASPMYFTPLASPSHEIELENELSKERV